MNVANQRYHKGYYFIKKTEKVVKNYILSQFIFVAVAN